MYSFIVNKDETLNNWKNIFVNVENSTRIQSDYKV